MAVAVTSTASRSNDAITGSTLVVRGSPVERSGDHDLPVLESIGEVVDAVTQCRETVFVRFSTAPPDGLDEPSVDHETGIHLPGLSVNPLDPPVWWDQRGLEEWVVRRICTYAHLQVEDPSRTCWIVEGAVVDRGPDNEPLVVPRRAIAVIDRSVVAECLQRRIAAGLERPEPAKPPWQAETNPRQSISSLAAGSPRGVRERFGLSPWLERRIVNWPPESRRLAAVRTLWLSLGLMIVNVVLYATGVFDDSNMILVTLILSWLAITFTAADLVATTDVREENGDDGEDEAA